MLAKRVKELMKQATPAEDGEDGAANEVNIEKYTELVIQECIDVIELKYGKPRINYDWPNVSRHMSYLLREHFRVTR